MTTSKIPNRYNPIDAQSMELLLNTVCLKEEEYLKERRENEDESLGPIKLIDHQVFHQIEQLRRKGKERTKEREREREREGGGEGEGERERKRKREMLQFVCYEKTVVARV